MQRFEQPHLHKWLNSHPTMGDLMALCEENYRCLHSLVPQLRRLSGEHRSIRPGHQDLHLTIVEQTPYTTLLRPGRAAACLS